MLDSIQRFFMTSPFPTPAVEGSLWLLLALPFAGSLICGLFGRWLGRQNVGIIANAAVLGAFLESLICFWAINDASTSTHSAFSNVPLHYAVGTHLGSWFQAGSFRVELGMRVDHLSGMMLLVITGVGFLIHLYSTSYMEHDAGYARFFCYLNLFIGMMTTLVVADNLLMLFVGWEGVGLCSYLLIGFWYTDEAKAWAGRKAFITNRIGDFGFLIGTFLLVLLVTAFSAQSKVENFAPGAEAAWHAGLNRDGALDFQGLEEMAKALPASAEKAPAGALSLQTPIAEGPLQGRTFGTVLDWVLLLFLLGATGKSAQLPLYVWLPDAMAGPTPVSALIHAATMVTAGVYLFCRLNFLLVLSPTTMAAIAIVGALTALFAALIAFAQDDIKKVLAYSTISQLGFMFLGVGMGVFWAAMLHLVTHAFFKACLFLGAGSVMHGNADETDIKRLGGVRKEMPWTWATFGIATLAITGIVPLSGFFSKDAILHGAHETKLAGFADVGTLVYVIGGVAAFCTAFYMTRVYLLTFEGTRSPEAKVPHAHESPSAMTIPLVLLAALSIVGAVYAWPLMHLPNGESQPVLQNYLWPVFLNGEAISRAAGTVEREAGGGLGVAYLIAWAIALAGGGLAFYAYRSFFPARAGQPAPAFARAIRRVTQNKFYVDEIYDFLIVRPVKGGSWLLWRVVDSMLIDTVGVRGTAWVVARAGSGLRYLQSGDTQSYAGVMALALLASVAWAIAFFVQGMR